MLAGSFAQLRTFALVFGVGIVKEKISLHDHELYYIGIAELYIRLLSLFVFSAKVIARKSYNIEGSNMMLTAKMPKIGLGRCDLN